MDKLDAKSQRALDYHSNGRPGKIEVVPTKEAKTQRDLSLAYSPGVAVPCLEIEKDPENAYKYTSKGNLVAVISNGTAVLGLGDIGAQAGKPVMEGKGVLFKIFADIDVFDIEIDEKDPVKFVEIVKSLEPTFGGINLEDIKAPECFYIEQELKKRMNIPVMHDDQHGTAIISAAALLNALEIQKKKIHKAKFVVSGAGAAALSCIRLYIELGADIKNFTLFDRGGCVHKGRTDLDPNRAVYAVDKDISMEDAMKSCDVFIGLSAGNVLGVDLVKSMPRNPIVFAMANPDPEIAYELATGARKDIIMATGRSDYPNQVNNVLGFPYIFRGALDVRSTHINIEMKLAAVKALAELAKLPVPEMVNLAYNEAKISFGPTYIIPKPFVPRLLSAVAPAVAKAAMETGVAKYPIKDWDKYMLDLNERLGINNQVMRVLSNKAKKSPKKIVYAKGENINVLKAAQIVFDDGLGSPILLGNKEEINTLALENNIDLSGMEIIDTRSAESKLLIEKYADLYYKKRSRKGVIKSEAVKMIKERNHFGCMMVETGDADCMISGLTKKYDEALRPALQIIGKDYGVNKVAGMYMLLTKKGPLFLADTTVNFNPTAEELAEIVLLTAKEVQMLNIVPKIAMLSYSNFGGSNSTESKLVIRAMEIAKTKMPSLIIDGEMQANIALNKELRMEMYPFSELGDREVNTLIFPNLAAGNIAYNIMKEIGATDAIGPIVMGLKKPIYILQLGSSVNSIVNMSIVAIIDAQMKAMRTQSILKK
ncbi:MAG: NADP-dependent malic enzyme [Chitinophagaceae bacterium]|nr:MAG: NADP-dependent malic enzyme [Chitinophagaceae bacterium]